MTASFSLVCSEGTASLSCSGNDVIEVGDGIRLNEVMFCSDKAFQENGVSFCSGRCLIFCHVTTYSFVHLTLISFKCKKKISVLKLHNVTHRPLSWRV